MSIIKFNNRGIFPRWNDLFLDNELIDRNVGLSIPATNIEETEDSLIITMAVPGFEKKDINVELDNNMLKISSNKESNTEESDKNFMSKEYSYNSFTRTFSVPDNVKSSDINAAYENGELKITLPKVEVEVSKAKMIEVA